MKKYAVILSDLFEDMQMETGNFHYLEDSEPIRTVKAYSKEHAAKVYLEEMYDQYKEDEGQIQSVYDGLMQSVIDYIVCGDIILGEWDNQSEIDSLKREIYDYYIESLSKDGKGRAEFLSGDEDMITFPGDDQEYIHKVYKKFPAERLMSLLCEEEKKTLYIDINMNCVMVMELSDI